MNAFVLAEYVPEDSLHLELLTLPRAEDSTISLTMGDKLDTTQCQDITHNKEAGKNLIRDQDWNQRTHHTEAICHSFEVEREDQGRVGDAGERRHHQTVRKSMGFPCSVCS